MQLPIVGVRAPPPSPGAVVRHAEQLEAGGAVLGRLGVLGLDEGLAVARGLPDLGEVVPLVVGVGDVADVGGPGAEPVAVGGGHPVGEPGAPVVADQVDRALDVVELPEQPVDVLVLGGAEARPGAGAEPGQRQRHRLAADGPRTCPRWRRSRGPRARRRSRRKPRCLGGHSARVSVARLRSPRAEAVRTARSIVTPHRAHDREAGDLLHRHVGGEREPQQQHQRGERRWPC